MELLAFTVFASQESESRSGILVFYVTDNQNVETWLRKRRPRGRVARRLILLLQRLEVEGGFTCHPTYIRTYRNELADWISRADLGEVRDVLSKQGWVEAPFEGDWRQIVEDARSGPLVLGWSREHSQADFLISTRSATLKGVGHLPLGSRVAGRARVLLSSGCYGQTRAGTSREG